MGGTLAIALVSWPFSYPQAIFGSNWGPES